MSDQEKGNGGSKDARQRLKDDFASLPLDKKLASLFELEMVALGESVNYVVNSSGDIFSKVADVVNDLGQRVECEFKKRTQDADATETASTDRADAKKTQEKAKGHKKPKAGEDA